jgi:hypothetical protein
MTDATAITIAATIAIPALMLLSKFIPQRASKDPVLKETDLAALDSRVKLYERVAALEASQAHSNQTLQGLKADNAILFGKLDDLKDLIIEVQKEKRQ